MLLRMRETSSLNNVGVRLFEGGLLLEAIDLFQLCLDQISECYQIDQEQELMEGATTTNPGHKSGNPRPMTPSEYAPSGPPPNPFHGWSRPAKPLVACTPYLFTRAIRVRQPPMAVPISDSHVRSYKAALHYNVALVQQVLLSKRTSPSSAAFICKHYEAAQLECKMAKATISMDGVSRDMDLLGLALLNNMGVVYYSELARFREASGCFRAACAVMYELKCGSPGVLKDQEVHELSMNAFLAQSIACPAA